MIRRITSLTLVVLMSTVGATSTFAKGFWEGEVKTADKGVIPSAAGEVANEKLRTAVNKLVADAKAGRIATEPRPQTQTRNSSNLSKGTKIAIGVGVAVAIVAIIVIAKADNGPSGSIRIF